MTKLLQLLRVLLALTNKKSMNRRSYTKESDLLPRLLMLPLLVLALLLPLLLPLLQLRVQLLQLEQPNLTLGLSPLRSTKRR